MGRLSLAKRGHKKNWTCTWPIMMILRLLISLNYNIIKIWRLEIYFSSKTILIFDLQLTKIISYRKKKRKKNSDSSEFLKKEREKDWGGEKKIYLQINNPHGDGRWYILFPKNGIDLLVEMIANFDCCMDSGLDSLLDRPIQIQHSLSRKR